VNKIGFKSSLKTQLVISFLLTALISTLGVTWLLYSQAGKYLKGNLFSYLQGISEMKKEALVMQIKNRKNQVERGSQSLRVLNALSGLHGLSGQGRSTSIDELREVLGKILSDSTAFEEVYIVDPAGKVLVSTRNQNEGKDLKMTEYFVKGSEQTYFQSFFISPVTRRLSLVAAAPIKKPNEKLMGVLVGRINLEEFFRTTSEVSGLGSTGESYLGNQDNGEAVFLMPTRNDPESALKIRIKLGDAREKALQNAVQGADGNGVVEDYRGKMVMASWNYIQDLKWGLVTKIDREEFQAPMVKWRKHVFLLTLILIIFAGVVSYFFAVRIVKPINLLTEAAERISMGELDLKIDVQSENEIGNLANSFERMLAAIKILKEDEA
jgi:HAMP domain-containing protein